MLDGVLCGACNLMISPRRPRLSCSGFCGKYYHLPCTDVPLELYYSVCKYPSFAWTCKTCSQKLQLWKAKSSGEIFMEKIRSMIQELEDKFNVFKSDIIQTSVGKYNIRNIEDNRSLSKRDKLSKAIEKYKKLVPEQNKSIEATAKRGNVVKEEKLVNQEIVQSSIGNHKKLVAIEYIEDKRNWIDESAIQTSDDRKEQVVGQKILKCRSKNMHVEDGGNLVEKDTGNSREIVVVENSPEPVSYAAKDGLLKRKIKQKYTGKCKEMAITRNYIQPIPFIRKPVKLVPKSEYTKSQRRLIVNIEGSNEDLKELGVEKKSIPCIKGQSNLLNEKYIQNSIDSFGEIVVEQRCNPGIKGQTNLVNKDIQSFNENFKELVVEKKPIPVMKGQSDLINEESIQNSIGNFKETVVEQRSIPGTKDQSHLENEKNIQNSIENFRELVVEQRSIAVMKGQSDLVNDKSTQNSIGNFRELAVEHRSISVMNSQSDVVSEESIQNSIGNFKELVGSQESAKFRARIEERSIRKRTRPARSRKYKELAADLYIRSVPEIEHFDDNGNLIKEEFIQNLIGNYKERGDMSMVYSFESWLLKNQFDIDNEEEKKVSSKRRARRRNAVRKRKGLVEVQTHIEATRIGRIENGSFINERIIQNSNGNDEEVDVDSTPIESVLDNNLVENQANFITEKCSWYSLRNIKELVVEKKSGIEYTQHQEALLNRHCIVESVPVIEAVKDKDDLKLCGGQGDEELVGGTPQIDDNGNSIENVILQASITKNKQEFSHEHNQLDCEIGDIRDQWHFVNEEFMEKFKDTNEHDLQDGHVEDDRSILAGGMEELSLSTQGVEISDEGVMRNAGQKTVSNVAKTKAEREKERERKIGHRRVGVGGEITYKKIQSTQIMGSIQLGIQHAVGGLASKPERDLLMQDFMTVETTNFPSLGSNHTPAHHFSEFKFKNYAPIAFRYFRDLFGIQPDDFLMSMCNSRMRELSNPGASGSIFYVTSDDEFIIKTVQHKEGEFLQKLLPGYYMNLNQNPRTLLPKFFGLYCYQCNSKNVRLVIMNNLLPSNVAMHQKYDLKGSTYKRKASKAERQKRSPTYKDLDFMEHHPEGILMEADTYTALVKTIQRDCRVLESFKIMDYSLLLAIHNLDQAQREKMEKKSQTNLEEVPEDGEAGDMSSAMILEEREREREDRIGAAALNRSRSINRQRLVAHSTAMESIQAESEPIDEDDDTPPGGIPARNAKGERLLLFIGIIDILQSYRLKKKLEHTWKSMIHDGDTVSVHRPSFYAQRFQKFMSQTVFKKIPSPLKHSPSKRKSLSRPLGRHEELNEQDSVAPSCCSTPPPTYEGLEHEPGSAPLQIGTASSLPARVRMGSHSSHQSHVSHHHVAVKSYKEDAVSITDIRLESRSENKSTLSVESGSSGAGHSSHSRGLAWTPPASVEGSTPTWTEGTPSFTESSSSGDMGCPTTPLRHGTQSATKLHHKKTVEHAINCLTTEMTHL